MSHAATPRHLADGEEIDHSFQHEPGGRRIQASLNITCPEVGRRERMRYRFCIDDEHVDLGAARRGHPGAQLARALVGAVGARAHGALRSRTSSSSTRGAAQASILKSTEQQTGSTMKLRATPTTEACDSLGFTLAEQIAMGQRSGRQACRSPSSVMLLRARPLAPGVTPWIALAHLDRIWTRVFDGGGGDRWTASSVPRRRPSSFIGLPLIDDPLPPQRLPRCLPRQPTELFSEKAYVQELAARRAPGGVRLPTVVGVIRRELR